MPGCTPPRNNTVCRASFSRRYLAYAHVKEAHSKVGHVDPLDHGRELREEYRALLEVCFPGASSRRKNQSPQSIGYELHGDRGRDAGDDGEHETTEQS
ncbi:hypothetical protein ANCDUO_27045, partial [Ancylostoma duodenale]